MYQRQLWILVFSFLAPAPLFACDLWAAKVIATNGEVSVENLTQPKDSHPVSPDSIICSGQRLVTGNNSRAAIYLSNNSFVRISANAVLIFPEQKPSEGFWVQVQQGIAHFISRISQPFKADTPYMNAAIKGTEFLLSANSEDNSLSVMEGQVDVSRAGDSPTQVNSGQKYTVAVQSNQYRLTQIDKTETVDWAIYYPPILTLNNTTSDQASTATDKAALQLASGEVTAAMDQLATQTSATALALQSTIQTAKNKPEAAITLANQAIAAEPQSLPALIALSYAQQANLDLPAATHTAEQATQFHPNSSLAWARLGELQLASGNTRDAGDAVQKAVDLDPDNTHALTQLAFVNLFRLQLPLAQQQFNQALSKDPENPKSHLGLGLTLLRQGEVAAGRRELEVAASLDPARSVLRSYLGRAYFAEKRDAVAQTQWQLAKDFDPQDPTPWFYSGVSHLLNNSPIKAIRDIGQSQQLNNQRALYRDETLLQTDAASRSATLARAYREVGYEQGVALAAYTALQNDPTSSEGHRLLADTYRGNRRLEAAQASELLQAQLLQPASTYPLQPQLAETDLGLVANLGPSRLGENEYHSLFIHDDINLQASGLMAGNDTSAAELVLSGLYGPLSASVGQYHYETDGYWDAAEQKQDALNAFAKLQVTAATSVEFEYRDLDIERGITGLSQIAQEKSLIRDQKTYRLGSYTQLTPQQGIMFSAISQEFTEKTVNEVFPGFLVDSTLEENPWIAEIKYLGQIDRVKIELGTGQYSATEEVDSIFGNSSQDRTHRNSYVYIETPVGQRLNLEAGIAYDDLELENEPDSSQWSPKFGASWQGDNWTLRSAYFRSFKRDLAANQTIEKTLVAGFNQIHSDLNAADSQNWGIALDTSPTDWVKIGAEFFKRDIDFPVIADFTNDLLELSYSQEYSRAYVDIFITDKAVLNLGYEYTDNDFDYVREQQLTSRVARSETQIVPIGFSYFHNQIFTTKISANYVNQKNTLSVFDLTTFQVADDKQHEEEWFVDLEFQARLPKRLGVFEIGIKNLFDEDVEVLDESAESLRFYPKQLIYSRIQLFF